ncbi:flagellar filament capping protein FliD [uncultured Anaeromusa sp.]|uniref:flagellar filament capping protein FliD n=1 Tax=uncultured Anaeromusa sp. TaxID=673273 RepID=UPI0029C7B490|nr:flagellar filament capping protein FliD [uncultured Anaeromusa sp.]
MATTSSGSVTTSTVNGTTRITGLSSGLDVDSIVKGLMDAEKVKLNKMEQQEDLLTWKQEAYRNTMGTMNTFSSTYLDSLSASSITKQGNFLQYEAESSDTAYVTAEASANAKVGSHTLAVSQLATAHTLSSGSAVSKGVQGGAAPTYGFTSGTTWKMYVDAKLYSVDLSSVTDQTSLQTAVDKAVGSGKITVGTNAGCLTLTSADAGVQYISVETQNLLGFTTSGVLANRITTSQTLSTINSSLNSSFSFNASDEISFTINGESFTFDKDDTLSAVMSTVNKSDAGVTMSYDSMNDKIVLTSKTMGAGATLTASDNSGGGSFISTLLNTDTAGKDAKLTLDGQALTRNSNTVTVDGVTYTLNKKTTSDITIGVTQNSDATFDVITKFVNGYNTLIDTIRGKLTEKYSRDYQPLTDAQKSSMSESDITAWEKKAKTGLLQRDDMLQSFLDELRGAFMASVPGVSQTLKSIGITSSSYSDYGKLTIDESTLKSAIKSDPEGVMNLFSQKSTSYSTSSVRSLSGTEQAVRYKEEGYGMRFYDIFQKYVGTSRDSAGNKGLLVEKAGLADDASSADNSLSDQMEDMKERITNEEKRLSLVQTRYYTEYTNMETYLNKLTTQMSVFSNNSSG